MFFEGVKIGRAAVVGKSGKFYKEGVEFTKHFLWVTSKAESTEMLEFLKCFQSV